MEKEETAEQSQSLFPVFPTHSQYPSVHFSNPFVPSPQQWLSNTSFTTDLSVINDSVSKYDPIIEQEEEDGDDEKETIRKSSNQVRQPQYELVNSPDSSSSDEAKKRKKKKKKGKRYDDEPTSYNDFASRKPGVRKWASSSSSPPSNDKIYYFDSHGDPDNLAFGSIYKMDVARYKLISSKKTSWHNYFRLNRRGGDLDKDGDVDALDNKLRSEGRYWSAKYSALERHKNLKRLRILAPRKPISSSGLDYIPLWDEDTKGDESALKPVVVEESWEDEVFRKTKEFNKVTREHPHDESTWLAFADFQDKVASMQPQKGARLQTLEKKISILEKATEINPDSEDLLLALMNAYRDRDSIDVLIRRWEKILTQNSGNYKLWREFLHVIQSEFTRFKVSEMRKMYANAIQALAGSCSKHYRQVHPTATKTPVDPSFVQLELKVVDVFLSLCRFEWQAGYQELATALFQAEIEYSLFCPSLVLTEQSKRRLFEHFWTSSGARIGEDGAVGWATWLEKEEEQRQRLANEESSDKLEEGGWTGWFEPLSKSKEISEIPSDAIENTMALEDEELETGHVEEKDDVEALLQTLGVSITPEAESEIKDTEIWSRWSKKELQRDCDQWMPNRAKSDGISPGDGTADVEDDELLSRVILYEDVSDYLFSLNSEEARFSLISQFIDFYEGRIAQWTCTNSSSWAEKTLSLETLPYSILEDLRRLHDLLLDKQTGQTGISLEHLLSCPDDLDMRGKMMKFLRNATLLCLTAFRQNYILEEAALVAEELSNTRMNSSVCPVTPSRALAKNLLKTNRQDVLLCGIYAKREAFFGNIHHARKIFDMALSSIEGLPSDVQPTASLLYFWYAEVELADTSLGNTESSSRAMHILSCLGSGVRYGPFKGRPSSLQQLRARQGFKDFMKMLHSKWKRGIIDDHAVALICSAALFEELTAGYAAALEIIEDAFAMVLPERRRQNQHLEFLLNYYVKMLCKTHTEGKLLKVWEAILKGLEIYPLNPKLYNALVETSHLHTSPNKLRLTFDHYCHKEPSVVLLLYALSFEMSRGGSPHRIRGLFERALENEKLRSSVILWRCYIEYERNIASNRSGARRVFFRAIHACPWSKKLWLDGFLKLNSVLSARELSDLQEVMRDKELNLRTDIYEILLEDDIVP